MKHRHVSRVWRDMRDDSVIVIATAGCLLWLFNMTDRGHYSSLSVLCVDNFSYQAQHGGVIWWYPISHNGCYYVSNLGFKLIHVTCSKWKPGSPSHWRYYWKFLPLLYSKDLTDLIGCLHISKKDNYLLQNSVLIRLKGGQISFNGVHIHIGISLVRRSINKSNAFIILSPVLMDC